MTHLSWVTLNSVAYSFIEIEKAVIYVNSLVRENILKGLKSFDFCLLQFAL